MNEKEDIKDYFKDETVETSNNNNILLENEEYNNIKEGMELSDKDMLNILNKEVHGVIMRVHPKKYPGYGWVRNAGYGTAEHKSALAVLGVTPAHRKSFAPIRKMLSPNQ